MLVLRKWAWASVVAVVAAAPAAAQQGTITSGGGATTGNLSGTGGLTGGGAGQLGGGGGGGGTGGSSSLGGSQLQGTQLQTMPAAPKLTPPTGQATSTLQKSNVFAGYYANPYFQGMITAQTNATPGGFGSALYGTTGATGTTGRGTTGIGGAGIGGRGLTSSSQSGILIPIPTQLHYAAVMQFPTPPVATAKLQTELRLAIDTPMLSNPKGVQILTDANNNVVLRGTVKDDEEARLVEGLVRLTPGVGAIRNELTPTVTTAGK